MVVLGTCSDSNNNYLWTFELSDKRIRWLGGDNKCLGNDADDNGNQFKLKSCSDGSTDWEWDVSLKQVKATGGGRQVWNCTPPLLAIAF